MSHNTDYAATIVISNEDRLKLQLASERCKTAELNVEHLRLQLFVAEQTLQRLVDERKLVADEMKTRYNLPDGAQIDTRTGLLLNK